MWALTIGLLEANAEVESIRPQRGRARTRAKRAFQSSIFLFANNHIIFKSLLSAYNRPKIRHNLNLRTENSDNFHRTFGRKGGGSSSSLFKKFANTNVGVNIRRPTAKPKGEDDDDSANPKDIFKKYSSKFNKKRPNR